MSSIELSSTLSLSHFDDVIGPELLYMTREVKNTKVRDLIPNLIDITQGKFLEIDPFIFAVSDFQSQNIVLSIGHETARGGNKEYLLSFILSPSTQAGFMAIMGLETFFLSSADEFRKCIEECHTQLETKPITGINITQTSAFNTLKQKMNIYHEEILGFVRPFIEK